MGKTVILRITRDIVEAEATAAAEGREEVAETEGVTAVVFGEELLVAIEEGVITLSEDVGGVRIFTTLIF